MFISKSKYAQLINEKKALCDEVQRLAAQISAQITDCKIGPWCNKCKYLGRDIAETPLFNGSHRYITINGSEVMYCAKHVRHICPEYECKI